MIVIIIVCWVTLSPQKEITVACVTLSLSCELIGFKLLLVIEIIVICICCTSSIYCVKLLFALLCPKLPKILLLGLLLMVKAKKTSCELAETDWKSPVTMLYV